MIWSYSIVFNVKIFSFCWLVMKFTTLILLIFMSEELLASYPSRGKSGKYPNVFNTAKGALLKLLQEKLWSPRYFFFCCTVCQMWFLCPKTQIRENVRKVSLRIFWRNWLVGLVLFSWKMGEKSRFSNIFAFCTKIWIFGAKIPTWSITSQKWKL